MIYPLSGVDDYAKLADIDSRWGRDALLRFAKTPAACGMVMRDSGQDSSGDLLGYIIGHAHVHNKENTEAEIVHIAVAAAHRRKGHGRALLHGFIAAHGRGVCHLEVAEDNLAAIALYESAGFAVVGRRKGYYMRGDGWVDALRMRLDTAESGI